MSEIARAGSLSEAVELATALARNGTYDLFRGQVRDWGSVRSTYMRLTEREQEAAWEELERFKFWAHSTAEMSACSDDELTAIAQHYQFATPFVDFSTDPRVAGFFAAHKSSAPPDPDRPSCIMCLNIADLHRFWQTIGGVKSKYPEPRIVRVTLPELWRLNAQKGVFLEIQVEPLERLYDLDRIYFPPCSEPPISEQDIYPRQQSALEIAIDQYKMISRMREGDRGIEQLRAARGDQVAFVTFQGLADGFEAECFGEAGLPAAASWDAKALAAWKAIADEPWSPYSTAQTIQLSVDVTDPVACVASLAGSIAEVLAKQPGLRAGPVVWHMTISGERFDLVTECCGLFWNGCRRLPYTDADIAAGLAATAIFASLVEWNPAVSEDKDLERTIVRALQGPSIEVEMGLSYGNYTRGYASEASLAAAVRPDFASWLNNTWRPQITNIIPMLQVAQRPQLLFQFAPFSALFVREVVPTQLGLRGPSSGKARVYNPERLTSFGLP